MLQYAIEEKTGNFVHVNTVPNGNQSGCICPECEDSLTAKTIARKLVIISLIRTLLKAEPA